MTNTCMKTYHTVILIDNKYQSVKCVRQKDMSLDEATHCQCKAQLTFDCMTNCHTYQLHVSGHRRSARKSQARFDFRHAVWPTCMTTKLSHHMVKLSYKHVFVMHVCQHVWACASPFRLIALLDVCQGRKGWVTYGSSLLFDLYLWNFIQLCKVVNK